MKQRQVSLKRLREELSWQHTVACCGKSFTFPGKPPSAAMYVCKYCGKEMKPKVERIRSREAVDLILKNRGIKMDCPDCYHKMGHHVVERDGGYFLDCAGCGTELAEIDESEVNK